jgi:hypothetical protein
MINKLNSKINDLHELAKLYEKLSKKSYDYQYRLDAIYLQIEILEELKSDGDYIVDNWKVCYKEDLEEYTNKLNI